MRPRRALHRGPSRSERGSRGILIGALKKIRRREALVGIIGLGYVGLPLVRTFTSGKFRVLGFDIDAKKVAALNRGKSYISHIPSSLISRIRRERLFEATDDFQRLGEPDAIIICVPTPLDMFQQPDLSYVCGTAEVISQKLRIGQLVVLESTTFPGTTQEVVKPILERSGLASGKDFFLAFSPEREDPGNPHYTMENIPKVVGGDDPESARLAEALYGSVVVRVVKVSGSRVAEASKVLENIYRAVNIALVNELKMLFDRMGIDVWEVIGAAATKPFGFHPFYPGPGLGGHCIPIDPFYLAWKAKEYNFSTRFIELAGQINVEMPRYVCNRLAAELNLRGKPLRGSKILILGLAYKKDVADIRESPALRIIEILRRDKARVSYHDPHVPSFANLRDYDFAMRSVPLNARVLRSQDAVIVVTDHSAFDWEWIASHSRLIVDTRNAMSNVKAPRGLIVKA